MTFCGRMSLKTSRALRLIRTKPAHTQPKFSAYIRYSFHQNAQRVSPRDISAIEHLMRVGKRQVEQLEDISVKDCMVTRIQLDWVAQHPGRRASEGR